MTTKPTTLADVKTNVATSVPPVAKLAAWQAMVEALAEAEHALTRARQSFAFEGLGTHASRLNAPLAKVRDALAAAEKCK